MLWTLPKVVLLRRMSAGYDTDRFVFKVNGQKYVRYYGDRYDDEQAKSLFIKEIERANRSGDSLF